MNDELRALVEEIGRRSFDARVGRHGLPERLDSELWQVLETSGLTRLTTEQGADPADAAVVLGGLARYAAAVPIAETDVLAAWLAGQADLPIPADGPMTVAIADVDPNGDRVTGTARDVPWPDAGPVMLAARSADATFVAVLAPGSTTSTHNLAGEPRGDVPFDLSSTDVVRLSPVSQTNWHGEARGRDACRSSAPSTWQRGSRPPTSASASSLAAPWERSKPSSIRWPTSTARSKRAERQRIWRRTRPSTMASTAPRPTTR